MAEETTTTTNRGIGREAGFGTRVMAITALVLSIIALLTSFYLTQKLIDIDSALAEKVQKLEEKVEDE